MNRKIKDYLSGANWLTKQERLVIQMVLALLLAGWAVKVYRAGHPTNLPVPPVEQANK